MLAPRLRAPALAAALASLAAPAARADLAPEVCDVEHFQRYLGETCVECPAGPADPEACRRAHAPAGRVQRCWTANAGRWVELWCRPTDAPAPAPSDSPAAPVSSDSPAAPVPSASPAAPAPADSPASGCGCRGAGGAPALALLLLARRRRLTPRASAA
jgi:hypothetical protein